MFSKKALKKPITVLELQVINNKRYEVLCANVDADAEQDCVKEAKMTSNTRYEV